MFLEGMRTLAAERVGAESSCRADNDCEARVGQSRQLAGFGVVCRAAVAAGHEACTSDDERRGKAAIPTITTPTPAGSTMLQSIADLKRYPVFNRRGDKLGAIDDVVLDADDWRICYVVLRYEAAGERPKLLGVPLDALSLDSENQCLVLAADDDSLRRASGFDRAAPPPRPEPLFESRER